MLVYHDLLGMMQVLVYHDLLGMMQVLVYNDLLGMMQVLVYHDLLGMMQVLVYHDLLGMMQHPHHAKVTPKFCKQFASVGTVVQEALQQYKAEVTSGAFPSEQYSPYKLPEAEQHALSDQLDQAGFGKAATAVAELTKSADK